MYAHCYKACLFESSRVNFLKILKSCLQTCSPLSRLELVHWMASKTLYPLHRRINLPKNTEKKNAGSFGFCDVFQEESCRFCFIIPSHWCPFPSHLLVMLQRWLIPFNQISASWNKRASSMHQTVMSKRSWNNQWFLFDKNMRSKHGKSYCKWKWMSVPMIGWLRMNMGLSDTLVCAW